MKKMNYLLSLVVISVVLVTVGCGGDDDPPESPEQAVTENLSKTWKLTSATVEGAVAENMDGFTLTINTNKGYTASSVLRDPSPWPSSGSWKFAGDITDIAASNFDIIRDDGLVIDVTLSETTLVLKFNFIEGTHTAGREEAIGGDWVMNFTVQ